MFLGRSQDRIYMPRKSFQYIIEVVCMLLEPANCCMKKKAYVRMAVWQVIAAWQRELNFVHYIAVGRA